MKLTPEERAHRAVDAISRWDGPSWIDGIADEIRSAVNDALGMAIYEIESSRIGDMDVNEPWGDGMSCAAEIVRALKHGGREA